MVNISPWFIVQIISFTRPIGGIFIFFLNAKGPILLKYILLFLIFLSDFLDGKLARKWNVTSRFGSIWDPICDKFAIYILFLTVDITRHTCLFYTLICKDILVLICGIYTQYQWKKAIYTTLGRSTMFFTALYLTSYMVSKDFNIFTNQLLFIRNLTNLVFFSYILEYIYKLGASICKKKI